MSEGLPSVNGRKRIEITEESLDATAPAPVSPPRSATAAAPPPPLAPPAPKFAPPAPMATAHPGSYCRACGAGIDERAFLCPRCGVTTRPQPEGLSTHQAVALTMNQKSPGVAVLLSLLLTGAGQVYCGRAARGLAFFAAAFVSALLILAVVGLVLLPVVWIWAAIDAHSLAHRQNQALLATMTQ